MSLGRVTGRSADLHLMNSYEGSDLTLSPNLGISCEMLFITKTHEEFGFKKDCVAQLLRNIYVIKQACIR